MSVFYFSLKIIAQNPVPEAVHCQRAVEILREKTDSASFRTMYDFAGRLQNPAFGGLGCRSGLLRATEEKIQDWGVRFSTSSGGAIFTR